MGTVKNAVKCVRDMCDFPPECYRLASDGRKWKRLCGDRQKLATWLAIKADGDGTRIFPGIKRMMKAMGWSRRKTCYVLHALQVIGCVVRESEDGKKLKTSEHGTARRKFNNAGAGVQDSPEPECKKGVSKVQDSIPEVQDWGSPSAGFDSPSASLRCTQPTPDRHQQSSAEDDVVGKSLKPTGEKSWEANISSHPSNTFGKSTANNNIYFPPVSQDKGNISVGGRTDGEIIAEFSRAMVDHMGHTLNATDTHRKAAVQFYKKHGSQVAIAAWVVYLMTSPAQITLADGKKEDRAWRLHDFTANGDAEIYAERVRPCIERGLTSHAAICILAADRSPKFTAWDKLAKDDPALVQEAVQVLNRFQDEDSLRDVIKSHSKTSLSGIRGFFQYLITDFQSAQVS